MRTIPRGIRVDGAELRRQRDRRLLTQEELSELSGVHVVTISKLERGEGMARASTVRKLQRALGVDPTALMEGEE